MKNFSVFYTLFFLLFSSTLNSADRRFPNQQQQYYSQQQQQQEIPHQYYAHPSQQLSAPLYQQIPVQQAYQSQPPLSYSPQSAIVYVPQQSPVQQPFSPTYQPAPQFDYTHTPQPSAPPASTVPLDPGYDPVKLVIEQLPKNKALQLYLYSFIENLRTGKSPERAKELASSTSTVTSVASAQNPNTFVKTHKRTNSRDRSASYPILSIPQAPSQSSLPTHLASSAHPALYPALLASQLDTVSICDSEAPEEETRSTGHPALDLIIKRQRKETALLYALVATMRDISERKIKQQCTSLELANRASLQETPASGFLRSSNIKKAEKSLREQLEKKNEPIEHASEHLINMTSRLEKARQELQKASHTLADL